MSKKKSTALHEALIALLTPVLRMCLRHSLRLQQILELVKVSLVRSAVKELESNSEKVSVSKVSLMTGVHRKDVTALLHEYAPRETGESVFRRVIGQWRGDKRFTSGNGHPRKLSHVGVNSDFVKLVRTVNRELNPYSVLFELERMKAVEVKDGSVRLLQNEFVPYEKFEESFNLVAQDVNDLLKAAEENIIGNEAVPNLHLSTSYDNIVVDALPRTKVWFMQQGAALHERARKFLSQFDKDLNPALANKKGGARVVVGTFSYVENQGKSDSQENKSKKMESGKNEF